jgi:hypothetical protein
MNRDRRTEIGGVSDRPFGRCDRILRADTTRNAPTVANVRLGFAARVVTVAVVNLFALTRSGQVKIAHEDIAPIVGASVATTSRSATAAAHLAAVVIAIPIVIIAGIKRRRSPFRSA